jgi:hypothetical protein
MSIEHPAKITIEPDGPLEQWPEFVRRAEARLEKGKKEYRNKSFFMDPTELAINTEEELLDVVNWTFILWYRLRAIGRIISAHDEGV